MEEHINARSNTSDATRQTGRLRCETAAGLPAVAAGFATEDHRSNVLVGSPTADDAAIYKLSDDLALVFTTDFFTPIVDRPYDFGAVAATNALSDVYAMGGTPLTALSIVGFPDMLLPPEVLV